MENLEKGDILVADIGELENKDASEIYPRRINHESGADHPQKPKTKIKRGTTIDVVCEIFVSWRSSQIIWTDTELLAPAHISHDSDSERPTKVVSRKHSIYIHFPEDRNCEVCLRTKMTRAPCRRRTDEAVPRAEKFGGLTTTDHQVLNEGGESRTNHRYVVAVQDLATQRIQSHPCKTKSSHEDGKKFVKILGAVAETESCFIQTTRWNLGKHVKTCH